MNESLPQDIPNLDSCLHHMRQHKGKTVGEEKGSELLFLHTQTISEKIKTVWERVKSKTVSGKIKTNFRKSKTVSKGIKTASERENISIYISVF